MTVVAVFLDLVVVEGDLEDFKDLIKPYKIDLNI
jgi:hypothetical protein